MTNIFSVSVIASILLSDIQFITGHREVEIIILMLLAFKFISKEISLLRPKNSHDFLFLFFIVYMLINTSIGIVIDNLSLHWLLFFLLFLPLISEAKRFSKYRLISRKRLIVLIVGALLVFNLISLMFFIFDFRGTIFTINSLLLPITVFLPFCIFSIKYGKSRDKVFAYIVILLSFILIILESSRGALMMFLVNMLVGLWVIGFARFIKRDAIILLMLIIVPSIFLIRDIDIATIMNDTIVIISDLFEDNKEQIHDFDRYLNYIAMFDFFKDSSISTVLFGTGYRSSWLYVAPYLEHLYAYNMPNLDYSNDRTVIGIPGIIVDIGIVGFLLLVSVFFSSMFHSTKDLPFRWKLLLMITILSLLARNYGNNVTSNVITMLVIMPYGVLYLLSSVLRDMKIDNKK